MMRDELSLAPCCECGGALQTREIAQEFERQGMRVSVRGVRALVCEQCGEIYYPPGGAQAVVEAANALFALAHANRQHKGRIEGKTAPPTRRKVAA